MTVIAIIAYNSRVGVLITAADDTTVLTGGAVVVCQDVVDDVSLHLPAFGTVAVVTVESKVRWKAVVSTEAGVVIDIVIVTGNSGVGEIITIVYDATVFIRGVVEVFQTSALTEVFVVSSLAKDVLLTEDAEMVAESAVVVTSNFAVVITVLKFVEAVVDAVISIIEDDGVLDFGVGESFKTVEESIDIRMVLLGIGSVAVVVWTATEETSVVTADNEDVEVDLEVAAIALATNVVIFKEITERVISAEDVFEVVRVDLLAASTDSVLTFESRVCWEVVVSARASVIIGAAIVAYNGGVGASITIVDKMTALTGAAVAVSKAGTAIDVSATGSLEKDFLVIEDFGIVDGSNAAVTSSVVVLVTVPEFVAAVVDCVTLVVEGGVVANSSVAESFKAMKERVAVKMDVTAIGSGVIVVSAATLEALVVVADN